MFNSRLNTIFRQLVGSKTPLTGEQLANLIQVSSRTIRNDIKELDQLLSEQGATINSVRGTGYKLVVEDEELFVKFLQEVIQNDPEQQDEAPSLPEERIQFLLKKLLLSDSFVKLEDLADELYISKSTVQNDMKDVKKILEKFGITLVKKPNYGFKLKGDEVKFRFCMSEYLFNRKEIEIETCTSKLTILSKEEMADIRTVILEQIQVNEIGLSDVGLSNLMIHIAIACKRIRDENYVSLYPKELSEILITKEYEVAKNIVEQVEERLHVSFPQTEVAYIAIHLLGTKVFKEKSINREEIRDMIDKKMYQLTQRMLEKIEQRMNLGISDDRDLLIGMAIHLKPAINRFRYGMNLRNPMLDSIKANYPVAFEAGVIAGMVLKEEMGLNIHENEIGYLALHIGAAMERRKIGKTPKRCIVVCASGAGSAQLLFYKLRAKFGSRLEILGTTEYYKLNEMSLHALDFVISTIPISKPLSIPVIEVNSILGGNDLEKVEKILLEDSEQLEFTKEELVFLQKRFETKEEIITFLGNQITEQGLVGEGFIEAVFEREKVSPTSFGNFVAIPHPISPKTDHTFWVICTLQKPITWGDKPVQFVCLLCVEKNNNRDLQRMYDKLVHLVDNRDIVQQLIKARSYREFTQVFLSSKT